MILILSHKNDDHAAEVLNVLKRRGRRAVLFDTSDYPSRSHVSQRFERRGHQSQVRTDDQGFDVNECGVAWWRRPQPPVLDPRIDPSVASFAFSEVCEAIGGLWASLEATWVNRPDLDERAHHKPLQLAVAAKIGLEIPRTLITNDPDAARSFVDEVGITRTIYKTFLATEQHWRETRLLSESEVGQLPLVRLAPVIFQEYVEAVADLRITVIGERVIPVAIRADPNGYHVDYRMDLEGAKYAAAVLPKNVEDDILRFMGELGLRYGAIDMRLTDEGRYVFLEVNPAGEWLFVEQRSGVAISESFVDALIEFDDAR